MALNEGMESGRVREIAGQLTQQAGKVGEVNQNGTTQVGTLNENWLGKDSEQFADQWQQAATSLQGAQDALDAYAKKAIAQADQQEGASGGA